MTPAARTQAAIDLVDAILDAARTGGAAGDQVAKRFFAARRYAGSKDRRAIRTLAYDAVRRFGAVPVNARAAIVALAESDQDLAATFDGSSYGPAPIAAGEPRAEPGFAPEWLVDALRHSGLDDADLAALLERAPLDIRVNRLRTDRDALLGELGGEPAADLPDAIRLPADTLPDSEALRDGRAEVQDFGSQIVALAACAEPGGFAIDLCAGGGGKTLAIAAQMAGEGRILATDTDRPRLSRLAPRAARAGVSVAEPRLLDPGKEAAMLADVAGQADWVMVDAPCSGTGTWRRNPEARWRLTPDRLDRVVATQQRLLDIAAGLTAPTGTITYVVCSLLDAEGAGQVDAFLTRHPEWRALPLALPRGRVHGPGMRLTPASDSTDGFFVARLGRG
ncbi:RNA methyltransferase [Sphingomonas sp. Leaf24]|uniref:RsmB/NOP family class I SAM-dependent RNA methyltransferase n=1 Tax=unclassified Sphingomonas TaxID=196159 RepID=UPI0007004E2D|nr:MULTISPECIES: RsmB/NOP family class I SAM-dependent RNA methyltransferase [unclassified Sphingomonas]KQM19816.1 RNA methyltransferase [Sphingomonas sp. Leaf5]KQM91423.1 RNA methyltransferase [Sphingomonas sp. Leaf24]KQM93468.1 RNA methyltransferase [Sphingomonas sp. Leaf22]